MLNLEHTFEQDFLKYQPDLNFVSFLSQGKRKEFEAQLKLWMTDSQTKAWPRKSGLNATENGNKTVGETETLSIFQRKTDLK